MENIGKLRSRVYRRNVEYFLIVGLCARLREPVIRHESIVTYHIGMAGIYLIFTVGCSLQGNKGSGQCYAAEK